jgi:ribosome recycling factor
MIWGLIRIIRAIRIEQLEQFMDTVQLSLKFQKIVDTISSDISSIRTGRATSGLVENIIVPAYGGTQRLRVLELASITTPDPTSLVISPWDKSIIGDIKKGILEANVGLNPYIDGEIIRIVIPPMTTEDREKFVKLLSQKIEFGRVQIRQIRADEMHEIKKRFEAKEITEDDRNDEEKKLQDLTDQFIAKIEELGEKKKQDLMQI